MEEEDVLLTRYGEPVTGTVNYFKMNTDVNRKGESLAFINVHAAQIIV